MNAVFPLSGCERIMQIYQGVPDLGSHGHPWQRYKGKSQDYLPKIVLPVASCDHLKKPSPRFCLQNLTKSYMVLA